MTKDNHMTKVYIIITINTLLMLYSILKNIPIYLLILPLNGWASVSLYWQGYDTGYKTRNKLNEL